MKFVSLSSAATMGAADARRRRARVRKKCGMKNECLTTVFVVGLFVGREKNGMMVELLNF